MVVYASVLAYGKLKQEDSKSEDNLGHIVIFWLKTGEMLRVT